MPHHASILRKVRSALFLFFDDCHPRRIPAGTVEVVLSYCHCCLVDRTLQQLLPYLHSRDVGVINASVLSMGLLTKQASQHATLLSYTRRCLRGA